MDANIRITRNENEIRLDIDTSTPLGSVWSQQVAQIAILQATMNIPNMSLIIKDGSDEYYKALFESLENRIKSIKNMLPSIEINLESIKG
jgi:hypothetical protein